MDDDNTMKLAFSAIVALVVSYLMTQVILMSLGEDLNPLLNDIIASTNIGPMIANILEWGTSTLGLG